MEAKTRPAPSSPPPRFLEKINEFISFFRRIIRRRHLGGGLLGGRVSISVPV